MLTRQVGVQRVGPYRLWEHTHRLAAVPDGTEIYDHVRYRVPGGPLARLVDRFVRPLLDEIFDYRATRIMELFAAREEVQGARLRGQPRVGAGTPRAQGPEQDRAAPAP